MLTALNRAKVLNDVLEQLGRNRALEAGSPNVTPEPTKMGVDCEGRPIVGVDFTEGKYRARIRVCDALSGADKRITLIRTDCVDEAAYAYRVAHIALWGSASWAANDDTEYLTACVGHVGRNN